MLKTRPFKFFWNEFGYTNVSVCLTYLNYEQNNNVPVNSILSDKAYSGIRVRPFNPASDSLSVLMVLFC